MVCNEPTILGELMFALFVTLLFALVIASILAYQAVEAYLDNK
jgi:hypothetical protein